MRNFLVFALMLTVISMLGTGGCAQKHPTVYRVTTSARRGTPTCEHARRHLTILSPSDLNQYSLKEDVAFGANQVADPNSRFAKNGTVSDASLQGYLNELAKELLAVAPEYAKHFIYRVNLYRDPTGKNAYAVPGGNIFMSLEIIGECPNEGALAGIVAHEMGHIALRHSTARMTFEEMAKEKEFEDKDDMAIPALIRLSPEKFRCYKLFTGLEKTRGKMSVEQYQRLQELEADIFSAQLLARSRFNPADYAAWHATRAITCDGEKADHVTHPLYRARATAIRSEIEGTPARHWKPAIPDTKFDVVRTRAQTLAQVTTANNSTSSPSTLVIVKAPAEGLTR